MLGCLLAATQLHAHETGLHDIDHGCISCDLEDVLSHGAVPETVFSLKADMHIAEVAFYAGYNHSARSSFISIRAPPLHS